MVPDRRGDLGPPPTRTRASQGSVLHWSSWELGAGTLRPRSMRILAVAAATVLALAACGGEASGPDVFTGRWTNPSGGPAQQGSDADFSYQVFADRMAEHCDSQSAVSLNVAWPPGRTQRAEDRGEVRFYIRDPEDVTGSRPGLDLDAALPAGSAATGYRVGTVELWFGPDGGTSYAYLVDGPDVERWPRPDPVPGCA